MDFKSMNPLGIIGIIGAVILVVGVFIGWLSFEAGSTTYTWSGLDVFNNATKGDGWVSLDEHVGYKYVPLVALLCGIISLLLMIVPTIMNTEKFTQINNILGLVALILSAVVVICGLLFYMQSWTVDLVIGTATYKLTDVYSIGIGFWLVLVGGIITLVGGLMPIIKNKLLNKA